MDSPTRPPRTPPSTLVSEGRIVAVLRADHPGSYDAVAECLVANGIRSIELTLTTPGTLDHLPHLLRELGKDAEFGIGTVTDVAQAERAIEAGAHYLVTPLTDPAIIAAATAAGCPIFPGALTPTEVHAAWAAGASAVKIFPAQTVGPAYGSHLRGPFPDLQFLPSGGVRLEDIAPWLSNGALAVSLGGPLIGDALRGGSLEALAGRARAAVEAVQSR